MNLKKILVFGGIGLVVVGGGGYGATKFLGNKGAHEEHEEETEGGEGETQHAAEKKPAPKKEAAPPAHAVEEDDPPAGEAEDTSKDLAVTVKHVINLPGPTLPDGSRSSSKGFLKCEFAIIVKDPELGKLMMSDKPTPEREETRAIVREILGELSAEDLLEHETQITLRQDIVDKLNERYRPGAWAPPAAPGGAKDAHGKPLPAGASAPRPKKPVRNVWIVDWAVQR
jgi:flagellar basal body-associated protein FliL